MKKVVFEKDGFTNIVELLEELGLLRHDETLHGIKGISRKPEWYGYWGGMCWTQFSIFLTEKGLDILENSNLSDYNILDK